MSPLREAAAHSAPLPRARLNWPGSVTAGGHGGDRGGDRGGYRGGDRGGDRGGFLRGGLPLPAERGAAAGPGGAAVAGLGQGEFGPGVLLQLAWKHNWDVGEHRVTITLTI